MYKCEYIFLGCVDPLCNMSINSVTQELREATERIKLLQNQLAKVKQAENVKKRKVLNVRQQNAVAEIETVL